MFINESRWDVLFWIIFILIGIAAVVSAILNLLPPDILLGFVIIAIGVEKLAIDYLERTISHRYRRVEEDINQMIKGLEQAINLTRRQKDKTEYRIMQMDRKRIEMERRIDDLYRDLAKKIIEVENKLNDIAKEIKKGKR